MYLLLKSVNICYTNPYLQGTQYIKDVKFKFFFLNGLLGDPNFQHQGMDY